MGTEEDKTNNGVLITLFVMGAAAMLGGSAAIVGMTRTEMDTQSDEASGYADLDSMRNLTAAQLKELSDSKLPIGEARVQLLADIQRNPANASWATPSSTATIPAATGSGGGVNVGGGASTGGASGGASDGAVDEGAGGSAPQPTGSATAPAPSATSPAPRATSPAPSATSPAPPTREPKPVPSEKEPAVPTTSAPKPQPAPAPTE